MKPSETLTEQKITNKANHLLNLSHVKEYYDDIMQDVREREADKATWTRDLATQKLLKLIEKAEEELYTDGQKITVSRMNAILLPVKELNLMNGFNETNVNNIMSAAVQFVGEDQLED